jgi:hypothetical protein
MKSTVRCQGHQQRSPESREDRFYGALRPVLCRSPPMVRRVRLTIALIAADICLQHGVHSGLQPFSKRVNLSEKVALSIQSIQKALYPARLNRWDHPL